jgi:hypothetical protein
MACEVCGGPTQTGWVFYSLTVDAEVCWPLLRPARRRSHPNHHERHHQERHDLERRQRVVMPATVKTCTKCLTQLPATGEFFPPNRNVSSRLGSWCRACSREAHDRWRDNNPRSPTPRRTGSCERCGTPYTARLRVQRFCCKRCQVLAYRQTERQRRAV